MPATILQAVCSDTFAGVQRVILTLCQHLDRSRFTPLIASPGHPKMLEECAAAGIAHHTIPFAGMKDLGSVLALRRLIHAQNVDLVHAHLGITSVHAGLALQGAATPLVISRHFIQENYTRLSGWKYSAALSVYARLNARAARVIAVSHAVAAAVLSREANLTGKLTVIPNGIPIPPPPQDEAKWSALASGAPPELLTISRLDEEKRLDVLLDALFILKNQGAPFHATLLGTGQLEQALKSQAARLGLGDSLTFTGFVPDPVPFLRRAHCLVHTAAGEPFGLALVEAMAHALPVVAHNSGGPAEIVSPGQTGILVPAVTPEAFASALTDLFSNTSPQAFGQSGYQRAAKLFSAQTVCQSHEALYQSLLECPTRSAPE